MTPAESKALEVLRERIKHPEQWIMYTGESSYALYCYPFELCISRITKVPTIDAKIDSYSIDCDGTFVPPVMELLENLKILEEKRVSAEKERRILKALGADSAEEQQSISKPKAARKWYSLSLHGD